MDRSLLRQVALTLILAFLYATRCSQYADTHSLEKSGVIHGPIPNCFLCFTHNLMLKNLTQVLTRNQGQMVLSSLLQFIIICQQNVVAEDIICTKWEMKVAQQICISLGFPLILAVENSFIGGLVTETAFAILWSSNAMFKAVSKKVVFLKYTTGQL